MERKLVMPGQLTSILNTRLAMFNESKLCRITGITPVAAQNETACNWSSVVAFSSTGCDRAVASPFVRRVVMAAQKEFNLKPILP